MKAKRASSASGRPRPRSSLEVQRSQSELGMFAPADKVAELRQSAPFFRSISVPSSPPPIASPTRPPDSSPLMSESLRPSIMYPIGSYFDVRALDLQIMKKQYDSLKVRFAQASSQLKKAEARISTLEPLEIENTKLRRKLVECEQAVLSLKGKVPNGEKAQRMVEKELRSSFSDFGSVKLYDTAVQCDLIKEKKENTKMLLLAQDRLLNQIATVKSDHVLEISQMKEQHELEVEIMKKEYENRIKTLEFNVNTLQQRVSEDLRTLSTMHPRALNFLSEILGISHSIGAAPALGRSILLQKLGKKEDQPSNAAASPSPTATNQPNPAVPQKAVGFASLFGGAARPENLRPASLGVPATPVISEKPAPVPTDSAPLPPPGGVDKTKDEHSQPETRTSNPDSQISSAPGGGGGSDPTTDSAQAPPPAAPAPIVHRRGHSKSVISHQKYLEGALANFARGTATAGSGSQAGALIDSNLPPVPSSASAPPPTSGGAPTALSILKPALPQVAQFNPTNPSEPAQKPTTKPFLFTVPDKPWINIDATELTISSRNDLKLLVFEVFRIKDMTERDCSKRVKQLEWKNEEMGKEIQYMDSRFRFEKSCLLQEIEILRKKTNLDHCAELELKQSIIEKISADNNDMAARLRFLESETLSQKDEILTTSSELDKLKKDIVMLKLSDKMRAQFAKSKTQHNFSELKAQAEKQKYEMGERMASLQRELNKVPEEVATLIKRHDRLQIDFAQKHVQMQRMEREIEHKNSEIATLNAQLDAVAKGDFANFKKSMDMLYRLKDRKTLTVEKSKKHLQITLDYVQQFQDAELAKLAYLQEGGALPNASGGDQQPSTAEQQQQQQQQIPSYQKPLSRQRSTSEFNLKSQPSGLSRKGSVSSLVAPFTNASSNRKNPYRLLKMVNSAFFPKEGAAATETTAAGSSGVPKAEKSPQANAGVEKSPNSPSTSSTSASGRSSLSGKNSPPIKNDQDPSTKTPQTDTQTPPSSDSPSPPPPIAASNTRFGELHFEEDSASSQEEQEGDENSPSALSPVIFLEEEEGEETDMSEQGRSLSSEFISAESEIIERRRSSAEFSFATSDGDRSYSASPLLMRQDSDLSTTQSVLTTTSTPDFRLHGPMDTPSDSETESEFSEIIESDGNWNSSPLVRPSSFLLQPPTPDPISTQNENENPETRNLLSEENQQFAFPPNPQVPSLPEADGSPKLETEPEETSSNVQLSPQPIRTSGFKKPELEILNLNFQPQSETETQGVEFSGGPKASKFQAILSSPNSSRNKERGSPRLPPPPLTLSAPDATTTTTGEN